MINAEELQADMAWLEARIRKSRTGISFDYIPSVDGEAKGYRYMENHRIDLAQPTLMKAITEARRMTDP